MAEEINDSELDLELETDEVDKKPRRDQRIDKLLSDKAKAEELAAKSDKAREKALTEAEVAKKDLDFFKNFNTISSKYQGAAEYQDQIKEKTALGLDVEEATILVLAKEGKYTSPPTPKIPNLSPVGGSAVNTIVQGGEKPISELTQDERRALLVEAEKRGYIGLS